MSNPVYDDTFVFIKSTDKITYYYNPHSIKIDKRNHIIKVWTKRVYTDKGKLDFVKGFKEYDVTIVNINKLEFTLGLEYINYKDNKVSVNEIIDYSDSGEVLGKSTYSTKWISIVSGGDGEIILNKILKDYNIQR